jgi:uncharacterized protein YlxW (UPF0749 family)
MDWMMLVYVLPSLVTGFGGFFIGKLGRKKQKNDILQEMQLSIDKLVIENSRLLHEVVEVKSQNADLMVEIKNLQIENERLRAEVKKLGDKVKALKLERQKNEKKNESGK